MSTDCLFCNIVAGTIEASFVHRNEDFVAIMDVNPVQPGHLLVLPTAHYLGITDLDSNTTIRLFAFAHAAAKALIDAFPALEGINILMSQGKAAQQSVRHSHLHVIPRAADDGMVLTSPPRTYDRAALDEAAARLRKALNTESGPDDGNAR